MLLWDRGPCQIANRLCHSECIVSRLLCRSDFVEVYVSRLCLAVIIALPAATPKEFKNTAKFALGDFTNCLSAHFYHASMQL